MGLFQGDESHTRLVIRESFDATGMPPAVVAMIEIPDVVMELKALNTVKLLAEGKPVSIFTTVYEIIVWLVVLVVGLISGALFVKREEWKKPLAAGVASVIVLLVITFLFPPLWLRGLLVMALLAGLVWSFRSGQEKFSER